MQAVQSAATGGNAAIAALTKAVPVMGGNAANAAAGAGGGAALPSAEGAAG